MSEKTDKSATKPLPVGDRSASAAPPRFLSVPLLQQFRSHLRKDFTRKTPQTWIPIECSLLIRYEFAALSPQVRYIFVAIMLYCGARGTDEIPVDIGFLSNALAVDGRMLKKSLEELEKANLLRERKTEREEKDRQTDRKRGVSVDSENLFKAEAEDRSENQSSSSLKGNSASGHLSDFTIEECLRYVEKCQANGDAIQNARALATNLYQTGRADAFIRAALYPERQKEIDKQIFGAPVEFTDEPCRVCFGAKMADADGKGFRACPHCKNERGLSTGFEPKGET